MTFLAALRHDRIDAPVADRWADQRRAFLLYVEKVLVPTLQPGDIVIMDNLGIAQGQGRAPRHPCRRRQAVLPAEILARPQSRSSSSSPSSNTGCAKPQQRTTEAVYDAIGPILDTVSPDECANYFANSGYDQT